ncbi:hypothetical protein LOY64_25615 [Pseudomonas corrugata]|uniref:hypothetical protein n=1 Tax=Pseudomonas corrugata TaxID=47879 RepID=UPI00069D5707|nr:hypothetical protein [Pseudomonas corrugata]UZD94628.1 hypothetical protein LOY64_25615 [Pseudomonas corrugata]UZE05528.1 hypothetical protein LOY65_23130 [Pseudomonas corrugata]SDV12550.1 hypothetical protein SAMN04490183_5502 [Pseudomonas corrugata]
MDSKLSFTAAISLPDRNINLLGTLHGKPALATITAFSGGFFSGKAHTYDHSSLLGIHTKSQDVPLPPLKLHFRHTAGGYTLSIKNQGEHHNRFIGRSWFEVLGVKDTDTPSVFTLVDHQNRTITLENITTRHSPLSLKTKHNKYVGGLRMRGSPYVYLAETDERSRLTFILSLI